jgi:hypothetical protein
MGAQASEAEVEGAGGFPAGRAQAIDVGAGVAHIADTFGREDNGRG